jgi:RimJ/RimL family protein N-acetyltransferase
MVEIRLAEPGDLPALRDLLARVAVEPEPERHVPIEPDEVELLVAGIAPLLAPSAAPNAMFVACVDGTLIGWLTMRGSERKRLRHACTLGITVDRDHRGRGVGRALIAEAIDWARSAGIARIELRVMTRHGAAIALYEQMGFVHEGIARGSIRIGDALHDDHIMGLLLE